MTKTKTSIEPDNNLGLMRQGELFGYRKTYMRLTRFVIESLKKEGMVSSEPSEDDYKKVADNLLVAIFGRHAQIALEREAEEREKEH